MVFNLDEASRLSLYQVFPVQDHGAFENVIELDILCGQCPGSSSHRFSVDDRVVGSLKRYVLSGLVEGSGIVGVGQRLSSIGSACMGLPLRLFALAMRNPASTNPFLCGSDSQPCFTAFRIASPHSIPCCSGAYEPGAGWRET